MSRWRVGAALVAWLLLALLALLASAGIGPGLPWRPATVLPVEPGQMESSQATLTPLAGGVQLRGADLDGVTMALQPVEAFDADRLRYLTLEFAEVPGVLRAMAVWRADGEVQAAPLPGAFRGPATIDLQDSPAWQGRIDALGFALLPTDYLAPVATLDRSLRFVGGRLESASAQGALRVLATQWRAYRPWNGRSNHTGGFELSTVPGPSLQAFVAALLLATLAAAWVAGGRRALVAVAIPALLLGSLVLAVRQVAQLSMRAQVAHAAVAAAAAHPQWPLAAMPAFAHDARALLAVLEAGPPPPRLVVWGDQGFSREYPAWLLRAGNVAALHYPQQLGELGAIEHSVLVLAGRGEWRLDPVRRELIHGDLRWTVEPIYAGHALHAFRLLARVDR
jgi:hypothetical protein